MPLSLWLSVSIPLPLCLSLCLCRLLSVCLSSLSPFVPSPPSHLLLLLVLSLCCFGVAVVACACDVARARVCLGSIDRRAERAWHGALRVASVQ